jgi:plasmid stabilization system protein ParE
VATKVWYCANCGYEVNGRGRCHSCGERLVASSLPELESGPDDDEVGYRLDMWDDPTRARLIEALINAGVRHRFEEEELVILAVDEAEVDQLVARVTGAAPDSRYEGYEDRDEEEGAETREPGGEDGTGVARQLYDAAKRLRDDPTDMLADAAVSEASVAVFALDYIPGMDDDHLAAVGRVTRRLLGALGADEALEDDIRHQAAVLCRLVAHSAGEVQEAEEEERALARLEIGAAEKGRVVALPQSDVTPGGEMGTADLSATDDEETEAPDEISATEVAEGDGAGSVSGSVDDVADEDELDHQAGPVDLAADELDADELEDEAGDVELEDEVTDIEPGVGAARSDQFEEDEFEDEEQEDDGATGELVYELAEWLPEQRVELSMLLESAGIAYNWDGSDLTVAEEHEDEVDGLFEQVHGAVDEDDEAQYHSIEELFRAVDRLANDPGDGDRRRTLLETVGVVEIPTPVGVDDGYWWRVRSQGHALVAAIEHGSRNDEVSREAALLAEMLHEMV